MAIIDGIYVDTTTRKEKVIFAIIGIIDKVVRWVNKLSRNQAELLLLGLWFALNVSIMILIIKVAELPVRFTW